MSIPVIAVIVCHGDIYDACILHLNIIGLGRLTMIPRVTDEG